MLHIIANQFTLTSFLLDSLPPARQSNVHVHPKRIKGPAYSLFKNVDALLPFELPGFQSFARSYLQRLSAIPQDAPVLIFGIENIKDLKIIRKHLRTRNVSVFTWNPVIDHNQNHRLRRVHIRLLKGLGFRVFTFDPDDAGRYDLALVNQVYRRVDEYIKPSAPEFDVYFLGKNKGRMAALGELAQQLCQQGIRPHFQMVGEEGVEYPECAGLDIIRKEVSYLENIETINRSRCLLELTQANQTGLTIRCMEAIFFGKKLITNNPLVKKMPFYHPDAFFLLGQDDFSGIRDFLQAEMPVIADAELARHEFSNWVCQFEEKRCQSGSRNPVDVAEALPC
ncbi:hypothetical protein D3C78_906530 [compost metagenome]